MKIRLIVPNVEWEGSPYLSPVNRYGRDIASIAGGFTTTQAMGGWIDGNGILVVEPVTVFDCHVLRRSPNGAVIWGQKFRELARRIARELRQNCVYLEIDGEVEFVKA
jgi:hypothetical protein